MNQNCHALTITISGGKASGKSTVAAVIHKTLLMLGSTQVTLNDHNGKGHPPDRNRENATILQEVSRLRTINPLITIQTNLLPKGN